MKSNIKHKIETFMEYDWEVHKLIESSFQTKPYEGLTRIFADEVDVQKRAIEAVDKITDFEKVEADMERITDLKKGNKAVKAISEYPDNSDEKVCHLKVFTIKRLRIKHFGMPVNNMYVEVVEEPWEDENGEEIEWRGFHVDSVYNLDRLTKMLSEKEVKKEIKNV